MNIYLVYYSERGPIPAPLTDIHHNSYNEYEVSDLVVGESEDAAEGMPLWAKDYKIFKVGEIIKDRVFVLKTFQSDINLINKRVKESFNPKFIQWVDKIPNPDSVKEIKRRGRKRKITTS